MTPVSGEALLRLKTSETKTGTVLGGAMDEQRSFTSKAGKARACGTRGARAPVGLLGLATSTLTPETWLAMFMKMNIDRFCAWGRDGICGRG
jgi:hypothetical protein